MQWHIEISDQPEFIEEPVKASKISETGVKTGPFYLTVENFIEALSVDSDLGTDAFDEMAKEDSTPPLPFGTIRYSQMKSGLTERITMEIPKKQFEIRYGTDESFYTVGFPRLVVQYKTRKVLAKKMVMEMRIFAVEDNHKPITDDTLLYRFPFPNVNKENGIVCWGMNEQHQVDELTDLERGLFWFTSAPFNEDYGIAANIKAKRFIELIHEISDKDFSDEWLIPTKKTFGDLFVQK